VGNASLEWGRGILFPKGGEEMRVAVLSLVWSLALVAMAVAAGGGFVW